MYNIFVIGAGFSKPAGLPLGKDLFDLIIKESKNTGLYSILVNTVEEFKEYCKECKNLNIDENNINFEEFLSYLDIENYLGLRGSGDPNRSQSIFK